jgi:hypothetical protein
MVTIMKKQEELIRELADMVKETKAGKLHWKVECQTTEYNPVEEKPVVEEESTSWIVDECYVSYYCEYKGKEFLMISYEMIHSAGDRKKTTNLVFLPPLGIRVFDIHTLLPYAVETSQMLAYNVHMLWLTILEEYRKKPEQIELKVDERKLTIEGE